MRWALGVVCVLIFGCGDSSREVAHEDPFDLSLRRVTLRAHLNHPLQEDPVLSCGETIVVLPDASERNTSRKAGQVTLPLSTDFEGNQEVNFLRGYAVGFWYGENVETTCK